MAKASQKQPEEEENQVSPTSAIALKSIVIGGQNAQIIVGMHVGAGDTIKSDGDIELFFVPELQSVVVGRNGHSDHLLPWSMIMGAARLDERG